MPLLKTVVRSLSLPQPSFPVRAGPAAKAVRPNLLDGGGSTGEFQDINGDSIDACACNFWSGCRACTLIRHPGPPAYAEGSDAYPAGRGNASRSPLFRLNVLPVGRLFDGLKCAPASRTALSCAENTGSIFAKTARIEEESFA